MLQVDLSKRTAAGEVFILHLYNTLGQIVYINSNYNNDFNSINVRSGIYYYNIELPNKEVYKGKLCIVH